ncbi:MAG: hypothetical protein E7640_05310 [Ruminococcaceae bacterium]|nr:hypothetical protein [Oscillospiraceae bacterium]
MILPLLDMICGDVYKLALAALGEATDGQYSDDYTARAVYLLPMVFSSMKEMDILFRCKRALPAQGEIAFDRIGLSDDFPLCDEFAAAAGYYLASLLIFDGDAARSDELFEKYDKTSRGVMNTLSFSSGSTVNKYPY